MVRADVPDFYVGSDEDYAKEQRLRKAK